MYKNYLPEKYEIIITEDQIKKRVKELGEQISKDYRDKHILIITVLKGAVVFLSDLLRNIKCPVDIDFIKATSYGSATESGALKILYPPNEEIYQKDVLIVEDIIDSGYTLLKIRHFIECMQPSSLKVCTFIDKKERRKIDIKIDYVGIEVEGGFLIGYGLDSKNRFRNLPFIARIIE